MNLFGYAVILCNINLLFDSFVSCGVLHNDLFKLDIVHYNDFHARFEETSIAYPVCMTNDTSCLGGFARLYQEIQTLLQEKPDALLLNAGDVFQGSYWYTLLKWNVTQNFINMLPNDAHAIGNHEFDDGIAGLAPYLAALRAPVVAANMDTTKECLLHGLYKPYVIVQRNGRRIGIIGLITPETESSSNSQEVKFLDPIATVQKEAELLTAEGVDIIIVLSHCGLEVDKKIASTVGDNIDIIVGGHSHSLLWNSNSPSNESVSGPYPVVIKSESKPEHKVLVVTASAFTKYLGNMTAYFDKHGELQSFDGAPVFLNRSIPENPEIKALLRPYEEKVHALVDTVVGVATESLMAAPCGSQECAIGDMAADSFVDITKQLNISNLTPIAFLLRSMIRGSIAQGEITRGEIINMLPFGNKVITMAIKGRHVVEALDMCLTVSWDKNPFNGPWMPQVAGLQVTLNTTLGRTVAVLVKEGEVYTPLEPDKEYQMTTMQFLLKDSANFKMLKNGRNVTYVDRDANIFENYVTKMSPITPSLDNRLIILE